MQQTVVQIGDFSYYPHKVLGQGSTGTVYLGFRNNDKQSVAVKVIKLKQIDTTVKRHLLDCEVAALSAIKNGYTCQVYDILKDSQYYFIPMEYIPNGTLRDLIKKKVKLTENEALYMFQKILQGYKAIRKAGFLHRDLKSQNILLRASMDPVIIDFGYADKAQIQGQRLPYNVGSPAYMSPEVYNQSLYSQKSDIWALGIVLHEMVTGQIPIMMTADIDQYFRQLKNMKTAKIIRSQKNQLLTKLLLQCLTVDTRLRYDLEELREEIKNYKNIPSTPKNLVNSTKLTQQLIQKKPPALNKTITNLSMSENLGFRTPQHKINNENEQQASQQFQRRGSNFSQWSETGPSIPNFKKLNPVSPTISLRETMPEKFFNNIRKRALPNNPNVVFGDIQNNLPNKYSKPIVSPMAEKLVKEPPKTPNVTFIQPQIDEALRLKKAYSFTNINGAPLRIL